MQPHSGTDCKVVLVAGDSIAYEMAPHLQGRLAAGGRCATVVNRAVPGWSSGDWVPAIGPALDEVRPDILVIELIGNEGVAGPRWDDPDWLNRSATNAAVITDAATSRGVKVFWAIPPIGAFYCLWGSLHATLWPHWASWVGASLPAIRPIGVADWRTPFGGETYSQSFAFPEGLRTLRHDDCVHLTAAGAEVAADATVFAIQHEWGAAAPVTTTTSTSTTSSTSTSTTSSTTTTTLVGG